MKALLSPILFEEAVAGSALLSNRRAPIHGALLPRRHGAGWLEPGPADETPREKTRRARHASQAADKLLAAAGRDGGPRSEMLSYYLTYEWLRRSKDPQKKKRAAEMMAHSPALPPPAERLPEDDVLRICDVMEELSNEWRELEVGDYFVVEWPDHLVARARRRSA